MAYPSDYLPHDQPRSGVNLHTQESGDAGLSSNMVHKFCYNYEESILPVTDTGTGNCVRPIPKAETDRKQLPVTAHPYSPASTVERFLSKSSLAGMQTGLENNLPHPLVDVDLADNSKGEEVVKASPGTATITQALMEDERGNGSIKDADVDARNKTGNSAPVDDVTNRKSYMKRAGGKKWKVYPLCVVAVLLINFPACKASDGGPNCFVCMDEDKCNTLSIIYNQRDRILYERDNTGAFPGCPEMPPPVPNSPETCTVCQAQLSIIIISCSNDTDEIQPEGNAPLIQDITKTCQQYKTSDSATNGGTSHYNPGREPTGLIFLVVIVVGALMIR